VRLPTALEGTPKLLVQPGSTATFTIDLALARAMLNDLGRTDIQLPDSADGAKVKIEELSRLLTNDYGLLTVSWHLIGHLQKNKAKTAQCTGWVIKYILLNFLGLQFLLYFLTSFVGLLKHGTG
jgi:hypothetical protein